MDSPETGASLYFGTAVDNAVEHLLKKHEELGPNHDPESARILYEDDSCLEIFRQSWKVNVAFGNSTPVLGNPNVVYSYADFDEDLLKPEDISQLEDWSGSKNPIEYYKTIVKKKKNPYKKLTPSEQEYFNNASWLSMLRKGEILINSFRSQFLPKVTKVHSAQLRGELKDHATGDSVVGYIDMVLEIEGYDKPIIFDLKTAAKPYKQEQIELTEQLTLYTAMKGQDFNTDLVGYVVLCKNINKEVVHECKKCGNIKNGRHKTCNASLEGVRCEGEWESFTKINPEVQVLVQNKTTRQVEDLMMDYSNIITAMKNNVIYKNTDKCNSWFGAKCPYYNLCHNGTTEGLIDKKRRR